MGGMRSGENRRGGLALPSFSEWRRDAANTTCRETRQPQPQRVAEEAWELAGEVPF
jgi:hypothetical protein